MKYIYFFYFFISIGYSQVVIQSQVLDFDTKQPLPMANIRILGTTKGSVSNTNGRFKITVSDINKKISVSYIGYDTQVLLSDNIPAKIYLKTNTLEEVIVMPDSMLKVLLKKAYLSIEKNYTQQRTMLSGFYRETVEDLSEPKFYYYSENLIDIIKPPYKSKHSDEMGQVRVNKSRTIKLPDYENLNVKFYGGTYAPILKDIVQRKNDVLKPEKYFNYHHTLKKMLKYDGRNTYQIEIIPKKDTNIVCNLFIDKESLAYSKIEIVRLGGVKDNDSNKLTLIFEKNDSLWSLKAFQGVQENYKVLGKKLKLTAEFVTTKFENDNVETFNFDQQLNYNESIAEVSKRFENDFSEDYQGVLAPDLLKYQFKSFYSSTYIDTLASEVLYKITSEDIANSISRTTLPESNLKKIVSNLKINLCSFYLTPYFSEKYFYELEFPSLNLINKKMSENRFFMTWNMLYKYKINKRWHINYISSIKDISAWFSENNYRLRLIEFGLNYVGVINKPSKPIYIMPNLGVIKNNCLMPFNAIENNYNFSEFTRISIDSDKIKMSIIERSYSLKLGVDFNFMLNTSHPNRHIKVGFFYSNPFFYNEKKVRVEEIEGGLLKLNKSFEISMDDSRIRTVGSNKFKKFPIMFGCYFSYNWGF